MVGLTGNEEAEILTLAEIISAQYANADCHSAFASLRKANACFKVDGDGVVVKFFSFR